MLTKEPCRERVVAKGYVDLYLLRRADFDDVLEAYKADVQRAMMERKREHEADVRAKVDARGASGIGSGGESGGGGASGGKAARPARRRESTQRRRAQVRAAVNSMGDATQAPAPAA